jgi:hypothetical protein
MSDAHAKQPGADPAIALHCGERVVSVGPSLTPYLMRSGRSRAVFSRALCLRNFLISS